MQPKNSLDIKCALKRENFSLNINVTLPQIGITAIIGDSGAGKSSLLRFVAGLMHAKGHCIFNGMPWQSDKIIIPVHKRQLGFVFQSSALFDFKTVHKNIFYGYNRTKNSLFNPQEIIALLKLEPLLTQYPWQLSGGEKQRVALARAVLTSAQLLLLDEPLASVDMTHKQLILQFIKHVNKQYGIPILYVSHSLEEVATLADHTLLLEKGRVLLSAPTDEVIDHIMNQLDSSTTTIFSLISGKAKPQQNLLKIHVGKDTLLQPLNSSHKIAVTQSNIKVKIYAKDISISLHKPKATSVLNCLSCIINKITHEQDQGQVKIALAWQGFTLYAVISVYSYQQLKLTVGQHVYALVKAVSLRHI